MTDCIRRPHSYWSTCPCDDCDTDRRRKHKLYSTARPYRLPSDAAWQVLEGRIERGWTGRALASACGLSPHYFHSHLADYRRGRRRHIGPNLAPIILNMGRPTAGHVGALTARRQLRALARIGYTLPTLHDETGVKVTTLSMIRSRNERCTAAAANAIGDAYDRLHMTPGGNAAAVAYAVAQGWPGPLAYDDIDDPNDHGTGIRTGDVRDLLGDYEELREAGESIEHAAARLGVTPGAIERALFRAREREAA